MIRSAEPIRRDITAFALATFASICAYKVLMTLHSSHMPMLVRADYGVIEGRPHWEAYQNRLLGPYLVFFISKLGITYAQAWLAFHAVCLWVETLLLFHLMKQMGLAASESLKYLVVFLFGYLTLQHHWFFTWDSVDLIVFTALAYAILNRRPLSHYLALFVVALLNRESALFIALFLAIDAFEFDPRRMKARLVDSRRLLAGVVLFAGGVAYTSFVRDALFISHADVQTTVAQSLMGNHINLVANLKDAFFENFFDKNILHTVAVFWAIYFFGRRVRSYGDAQFKCFLMFLALVANILIFGLFNETRMLLVLLPFVLFLGLSLRRI